MTNYPCRAAGQSRERRLPAQCDRGRGAVFEGENDREGVTSAGRQVNSGERTTYCHGYCDRTLDTRLGKLELCIPKRLQGSYSQPFLEPRKRSEKRSAATFSSPAVPRIGRKQTSNPLLASLS